MSRYEKTSSLASTPLEVYEWHSRPGALERLTPPWQAMESLGEVVGIDPGSRVSLRLGRAPLRIPWIAEHTWAEPGVGFEDVQVRGPFRSWRHRHLFEAADGDGCLLKDVIDYVVPGGFLGRWMAGAFIERSIARTFDYRHRTTADDLAFHRRYASGARLRVGITGSGGLIGTALTTLLTTGGHNVIRLVRTREGGESPTRALWDPYQGVLESSKVEDLDAVVHLAGENVSRGRWTRAKRARIRDSRIWGTRSLVESLGALRSPPRTLVSASAIGYYGNREEDSMTEESGPGEGSLADVCEQWEQAAAAATGWASRVVLPRFGVVLSPREGALAKMLPAFSLGAGGKIGTGSQFMSWISIDDAAGALIHILQTPELAGPVNIVAPNPVRNREFTLDLARVLKRPALLPMPSFLAWALFGQMAGEMILSGSRIAPAKLLSSGYAFRHQHLPQALAHLLGR